jgi:hypothetical protein
MNTNFHKIKELISKSDLNKEDKDFLLVCLSLANDDELLSLVELFVENINWVNIISENLKKKKEALINRNLSLWQEIIKEEKRILDKIESSL